MRLSPEQLLYTIDHAEDRVILVNKDFLPLLKAIKGRIPQSRSTCILTDDTERGPEEVVPLAGEYEAMLADSSARLRFPRFRREHPRHHFLHHRHNGSAQGRLLQPQADRAPHSRHAGRLEHARPPAQRLHRDDVYMPLTPMFHVHAWGMPYIATLMGVKQVYPGR